MPFFSLLLSEKQEEEEDGNGFFLQQLQMKAVLESWKRRQLIRCQDSVHGRDSV